MRAGEVTLSVTNRGPDTYELIVVRSNGKPLPLRSDGLTVDEKRVEPRTVGSLDGGGPHTTRTLRVHLAPGRYVLFPRVSEYQRSKASTPTTADRVREPARVGAGARL